MLVLLFYGEENWRGERAWRQCQAYLQAHNLPTEWHPPQFPKVPADQNFTETPFLKAVGLKNNADPKVLTAFRLPGLSELLNYVTLEGELPQLEECQAELRDRLGFKLPPLPREPALDVLDAMANQQDVLDELRQASLRPQAFFNIESSRPFTMDIPNFVAARDVAQLLTLDAAARLALGSNEVAVADMRVIRRYAEAMDSSPTLVAAMIAVAVRSLQFQVFWEGWAMERWKAADFAEFQREFHAVDLLQKLDRSLREGEIAAINHMLLQDSAGTVMQAFQTQSEFDLGKALGGLGRWLHLTGLPKFTYETHPYRFCPRGWLRQSQVVFNRVMAEQVLNAYDVAKHRVFPGRQADSQAYVDKIVENKSLFNRLAAVSVPNIWKALEKVTRVQVKYEQAAIVCALERFRLKHGQYPESLSALSPEWIPQLPLDPITGEPFKYQRQADGQFLLYSVGWDEKDDGGISALKRKKKTAGEDWVWPGKPL